MTLSRLFIGEKIRLTALREEDLMTIVGWYHDSDFMRHFDSSPAFPRTVERWQKWFEKIHEAKDEYYFGIRPVGFESLLGWLMLDGISSTHRNGWIAVAIGDETYRGRGYGREAMRLALDFAFNEINLHRVQLTVFSYNTRAIALYESLGFVREGAQREWLQRDGQRYDMLHYGMLAHEWRK